MFVWKAAPKRKQKKNQKCKISHWKSGAMELLSVYLSHRRYGTIWQTLLQATNWFRFVDLLMHVHTYNESKSMHCTAFNVRWNVERTHTEKTLQFTSDSKEYVSKSFVIKSLKRFQILIFVFAFETRFGGKSHENFRHSSPFTRNSRLCFIIILYPIEYRELNKSS